MPPPKSRAAGDAAALGRGRHRLTLAHRSAEFGPALLVPQSRQRRPGQAVEGLAAAPAEISPQSISLASNYRPFRRAVRAAPFRADPFFQQADYGFQGLFPRQRPTGFRTLVRR